MFSASWTEKKTLIYIWKHGSEAKSSQALVKGWIFKVANVTMPDIQTSTCELILQENETGHVQGLKTVWLLFIEKGMCSKAFGKYRNRTFIITLSSHSYFLFLYTYSFGPVYVFLQLSSQPKHFLLWFWVKSPHMHFVLCHRPRNCHVPGFIRVNTQPRKRRLKGR